MSAPHNVSKGFIDGNPFDKRSEVIEHIEGSIAQSLIILEMPADKDQLWTQLTGPPLVTPNDFASYEAASTTPPPTAMGLPRSDASSSCSTDA